MHPAYSIIIFTVASGAGYGLLTVALILMALGIAPYTPTLAWSSLILGTGLIALGLLSSTRHLHHPERAWRAFSQWRSSWLSREGVMAVVTFLPMAWLALAWITGASWQIAGMVTTFCALITVYCTSMIYASLPPIAAWYRGDVPIIYLVLALATGATLFATLSALTTGLNIATASVAILAVALAFALKWRYWQSIDGTEPAYDLAAAIGMAGRGKARLLDPPHTTKNYLQKEMGFRVARKHSTRLRRITLYLAGTSALLLLSAQALGGIGGTVIAIAALAALAAGTLTERWLFFAEAKHTVMLYYGEGH